MTATLNDIMNMVYTETNRPDMVAETQQAVIASTLKMHLRGYYWPDITPAIINTGSSSRITVIPVSELPNFRQVAYIRPGDANQTIPTDLVNPCWENLQGTSPQLPPLFWGYADLDPAGLIEIIEPNDILDVNKYMRDNIAYLAGSNLYIRTAISLQYFQFAWYSYPTISPTTYSSWIADQLPYAIVYDASSALFTKQGQQDVAATYSKVDTNGNTDGLVSTWLKLLDQNFTFGRI